MTDADDTPGAPDKLPVRMLNDRILVKVDAEGDRRSTGGILIPATAQMGKRLAWAEVRAKGPNVRAVEEGDHVLFIGQVEHCAHRPGAAPLLFHGGRFYTEHPL